jgi:arylformamidase
MSSWIDITTPIHPRMTVWKGDPPAGVEQVMWMDKGDLCNLTRLNISAHTGTHMDAPRHFLRHGAGMETLPPDAVLGPCTVVDIPDPVSVKPENLENAGLEAGARLLLRTRNSHISIDSGVFDESFVFISASAARWMADHQVRTVGIDYLSVGGFSQDLVETHERLLSAGIWIIEGLRLAHVAPGRYELACLPLLISGCDGAPARAFLKPL